MDMILEQNKMLLRECDKMLMKYKQLAGTEIYEQIYSLANDLAQDVEMREYYAQDAEMLERYNEEYRKFKENHYERNQGILCI